ncbi:hypothetical protein CYMTET_20017 [Cymbomonas tetramitiformis]|uniref:Uncharacterized protein n=1 Tax=Cymbomonas tetramitiformis TaxID=36881 RepID=A0AAE0G5D2_9CHLO|nr:hypothetical protein CYMTET_20017 [Cymbomonas tetramitiformis]
MKLFPRRRSCDVYFVADYTDASTNVGEHSALSIFTRPCVCATLVSVTDLGALPLGELKDLVVTAIYVAWQQQQADQGGTAGAVLSAAVPTGDNENINDDMFNKSILAAARQIENSVKVYHAYMDCPYGGKKAPAGTSAASSA